jgi:ribonuclease HI
MNIDIYTDGGCSGNPGPGGWAYVIIDGKTIVDEKWGAEKNTTNNKMELTAALEGLNRAKELNIKAETFTVYTDSQYLQKGITEWIKNWKKNNWKTSKKEAVKNQELWIALDTLASYMNINWKWVKGHAGNTYNERCDQMTQEAIASVPVPKKK